MTIQENIPLAPLTTLQVGGSARYFTEARSEDDVREAVAFAKARGLPIFVLGGGSNLVVADAGWPGLVLKIAIAGIESSEGANDGETRLFHAGAGVNWDDFVALAVAENCSGVECLSGIPGSVGGTPVQNVGAYGQEVAESIESVVAFDLRDDRGNDRVVTLTSAQCGFHYRSSIFNRAEGSEGKGERGRYIILQVSFRLRLGGTPALKYADLQKHFAGANRAPTLSEVREAVRQIRRSKGMLIVPGDADSKSVGSFFKNPVLGDAQLKDLTARAEERGLHAPAYPAAPSSLKTAQHKVSAAWLVEHSGFEKGMRLGRAGISSKHALALINAGQARATDIIDLKSAIQDGVERTWGVRLEPEPVLVGF